MSEIWSFKTARFEVFCAAEPEDDVDVSWADAATLDQIERGVLSVIRWHVGVRLDGEEIGSSYLGNSVYEDAGDFVREHFGLRAAERAARIEAGMAVVIGSYFSDMVREAIAEARRYVEAMPVLRRAG